MGSCREIGRDWDVKCCIEAYEGSMAKELVGRAYSKLGVTASIINLIF